MTKATIYSAIIKNRETGYVEEKKVFAKTLRDATELITPFGDIIGKPSPYNRADVAVKYIAGVSLEKMEKLCPVRHVKVGSVQCQNCRFNRFYDERGNSDMRCIWRECVKKHIVSEDTKYPPLEVSERGEWL